MPVPLLSRIDFRSLLFLFALIVILSFASSLPYLSHSLHFLSTPNEITIATQFLLLSLSTALILFFGLCVVYLQAYCRTLEKARGADTHAASHDDLTGVANRRHFENELNRLSADSTPEHALMMIDLDRFKPVNDLYGHAAGDELLKEIASGLEKIAGQNNLVARLGGDEFVVLLKNTSQSAARKTALSILQFVTRYRLNWQSQRISVGASIGVVTIDQPNLTMSTLLSAADEALYSAKEAGRGAVFQASIENDAAKSPTITRVDGGGSVPIPSANSHEPRDGRRPQLHAMVMAWTPPKQPSNWQQRTGSRRRREITHWVGVEPLTIGGHSTPGTRMRELIEDATTKEDGGADLARWIFKMALDAAAQITPTVISRVGFVIPIPAQAVVSVPNLAEELMRTNALALQPLRHLTFVLHNINTNYDSSAIIQFQQRLRSSEVHLGFEIRASTLDVLAPLHHTEFDELHLGRELVMNLKPGSSGKAAAEALLTVAEKSGLTLVATGADTVDEIQNLAKLGVSRISGQAVGTLEPLQKLLNRLEKR